MSIFDAYCDDLTFLTTDLKNNIEALKGGSDFDATRRTIQACFDQSTDLMKQAEIEARGHSSAERRVLTEKLKIYKDTFFELKGDFDTTVFQQQKSQLTGKSGEDRGKMLEANEKYDICARLFTQLCIILFTIELCVCVDHRVRRQNEIIENCMRTVAETEEIGIETIAELANNREKIDSARVKVRCIHSSRSEFLFRVFVLSVLRYLFTNSI